MATSATPQRAEIFVPDRFDMLQGVGQGQLRSIVVPVQEALAMLDTRFTEVRASRRGGFMIVRGDTGSGKSTFLDTVGLFREGVTTHRIPPDADIRQALNALPEAGRPVVLIEGREARQLVTDATLEDGLHAINHFLRSPAGQDTLVAWPTNTDDLTEALATLAGTLGGTALLGPSARFYRFSGPPPDEYAHIAERTVSTLNEGAGLTALGVTQERAAVLATEAETIGAYMGLIRDELLRNGAHVESLVAAEQHRLWIVVIASNDPSGEVAALTRGPFGVLDVDRLLTATGANIVGQLKANPGQLGILGTMLDAKLIHLDLVTALSIARQYGNSTLHTLMAERGLAVRKEPKAEDRLVGSQLGLLLDGKSLGTQKVGRKPGTSTKAAFAGLVEVARTNDTACNDALGRALETAGLIESYKTEHPLRGLAARRSDIYCGKGDLPIRIEVMWSSSASQAQIANYVLGKLGNYAKAIGLIPQ